MIGKRKDPLDSLNVFVAEDDVLISMLLEDILVDYGCRIVAAVGDVSAGVEFLSDPGVAVGAAILDVHLGRELVFPIAEILRDRKVPFVFATGSAADDLPVPWNDRPTLQKPFVHADVGRALRALVGATSLQN